jgi:hypothetical protein
MALIPYRDVPQVEANPATPAPAEAPLVVAGQLVEEFYCGDERCDCATGHVRIAGVVMTVDLGTLRVDFTDEQQTSPAREVLRATLRKALQEGAIDRFRQHYALTRDWGKQHHFRYVDWTGLKSGDLVPWPQVFRAEGVPMFTMTVTPPAKKTEEGAEKAGEAAEDAPAEQPNQFMLGLSDAYCVEPKCDCQRVVWTVMTAPMGDGRGAQTLGKVLYSFATGQPSVVEAAQGVHPNQLFVLVHNLLKGQKELTTVYGRRYAFLRDQLTPIVVRQRRLRTEARSTQTAGRNDPCPCGSGKKFKKCHGAQAAKG